MPPRWNSCSAIPRDGYLALRTSPLVPRASCSVSPSSTLSNRCARDRRVAVARQRDCEIRVLRRPEGRSKMVSRVCYLTHPQVEIDPAVPVPEWSLSALGRNRVIALAAAGWLSGTSQIITSAEGKAVETAEILAAALGLSIEVREAMHENDRSATGFLPPAEFDVVVDAFFANPTTSVRGWEPAIDAQVRIVRE